MAPGSFAVGPGSGRPLSLGELHAVAWEPPSCRSALGSAVQQARVAHEGFSDAVKEQIVIRKCMILGLAALAGCAGAAMQTGPAALSQPGDISLAVRTATQGGPGWQAVSPGATLQSG